MPSQSTCKPRCCHVWRNGGSGVQRFVSVVAPGRSGAVNKGKHKDRMGYVLRVRLASFFAGAAMASALGFYVLQRDYKIAHNAISQQVNSLYESLDGRIAALEKLKEVMPKMKEVEPSAKLDAAE